MFGLGISTYEHCNAVGEYGDKRLEEIGGIRVCEAGLDADDETSYVLF